MQLETPLSLPPARCLGTTFTAVKAHQVARGKGPTRLFGGGFTPSLKAVYTATGVHCVLVHPGRKLFLYRYPSFHILGNANKFTQLPGSPNKGQCIGSARFFGFFGVPEADPSQMIAWDLG